MWPPAPRRRARTSRLDHESRMLVPDAGHRRCAPERVRCTRRGRLADTCCRKRRRRSRRTVGTTAPSSPDPLGSPHRPVPSSGTSRGPEAAILGAASAAPIRRIAPSVLRALRQPGRRRLEPDWGRAGGVPVVRGVRVQSLLGERPGLVPWLWRPSRGRRRRRGAAAQLAGSHAHRHPAGSADARGHRHRGVHRADARVRAREPVSADG